MLKSASHCSFPSASPNGTAAWERGGEGGLDAAGQGLCCQWGAISIPAGTAHWGLSHRHLLCLSIAHGPSLQQETIALPSASPTLGKPPRQPAEQISGASHAGTENPLCCAVPRQTGWDDLPGVQLARGRVPALPSARRPVSAAPTGLRAGGATGRGTRGRWPGGQPAHAGVPRGWFGQWDGEVARGSGCAVMV